MSVEGVRSEGRGARVGWGVLAGFLGAFAVFESVKYGLLTTGAAVGFFLLPDLVGRVAGGRRRVVAVANSGWIPVVILVGYSVSPIVWPPLFTAGLGWATRLVVGRVVRGG
ncbi:hypothetical protein LO762_06580 [Actinocorallia sp. API 0066]|uniref:hypothetical protein n=1 Tax=Actinocorallia sp. API 0066 TaxID=2896846 RepID=UPI001E43BAAE|nr:hypothetical protein [Actinocorallia sp. API 0066]MCD0448854.1 hypothetical protein [Actinocorallia sp. API 0066]